MRIRAPWRRGERGAAPAIHADRLAHLHGRPYRLTSDAWERAPSFGFDFLADSIAKVILESQPQLTLAVYGDWGVGKTTLLRAIDERISEQCAVAWFDMWEYKNQEHVIAQLLDVIAGALPQGSEVARGLRKLSRVALASASLSAGNVSFSGKDLLAELDAFWEGPKVETQQLEALVRRWRRDDQTQRIVVIVDNLDRCLPEHSVGLLEQISSLFGFPGVVFVLAAERDRLASAVEEKHKLPAREGLVYLEKIVQVEFRLPGLYREHVLRWIRSLTEQPLELTDEDARLLAETAGWNARQIKRLLNNVRIQLCTARHDVAEDEGLTLASTLLLHHNRDVWLALTASEETRREVGNALAGSS
jgi:DNA polymerase III delta prime subunit